MKQVIVVIGPGQIGQAIARRVGVGFITGRDFLMDGGVTSSYFHGELAPAV